MSASGGRCFFRSGPLPPRCHLFYRKHLASFYPPPPRSPVFFFCALVVSLRSEDEFTRLIALHTLGTSLLFWVIQSKFFLRVAGYAPYGRLGAGPSPSFPLSPEFHGLQSRFPHHPAHLYAPVIYVSPLPSTY